MLIFRFIITQTNLQKLLECENVTKPEVKETKQKFYF